MKNNMFCVIVLLLFISCTGKSKRTMVTGILEDSTANSPFNTALDKRINEFISYNLERGFKHNIYRIDPYYDEHNKNCILYIGSDLYYDNEITRYYYINEGRLFVIEGADTACMKGLVDFNKMQKFKDSIPNYEDISKINKKYEGYTMMLKIINTDSLEVMSINY